MSRPKIVLLGMLTKIPVGGVIWLVAHYMEGFRRLGFDPYYVEAHARTPSMFMKSDDDDGTALAVQFLDAQMRRFGFGDSWAFHALHDDGLVHGPMADRLEQLYRDAALVVNMHGGTVPLEEHAATGRLVYLGTDPVELELEVHRGEQRTLQFLDAHCAYFTWGLNQRNPDCRVPSDDRYPLIPSPPPVILDWWENDRPPGEVFTTVGNWRQPWRTVEFEGETYTWSKHHEFLKVLDLPSRVDQQFELALSSYEPKDQALLEAHGWRVRSAIELSRDADSYRKYLQGSRGEFSVAKDQNVRLRSGWFSERSATYLAAGRPVILQETGFGAMLPTGSGLHAYSTIDEAAGAVTRSIEDLSAEASAAFEIAREYLSTDIVLADLLDYVGIEMPRRSPRAGRDQDLPPDLRLTPEQRRPLVLDEDTVRRVTNRPVPMVPNGRSNALPAASIVVVTYDSPVTTALTMESLLLHTDERAEIVVVDNASDPALQHFLTVLAARNPSVRLIANSDNRGFAAAANQGLLASRGDVLVIVNNDVIVTPGWLDRLLVHLEDPTVGAVGPVTNRCGNEAEVPVSYDTYGKLLEVAAERARQHAGTRRRLPMLAMFCTAFRREVVEQVGVLDERFGIGLFEDDDYARRLHAAGLDLFCADDVFVHHFGEGAFSHLFADGARSALFNRNRERYERKWGQEWVPHRRLSSEAYEWMVHEVTDVLRHVIPLPTRAAVVSRGDDRLVDFGDGKARHLPGGPDGSYAGHHPADDDDAIAEIERLRAAGIRYVVVPSASFWYLDHYRRLADHLDSNAERLVDDERLVIFSFGERDGARPDAIPARRAGELGDVPATERTPMEVDRRTDAAERIGKLPVCILGMHRSGTSLLSRLLNIAGIDLGPPEHLMKWLDGNPRGHWEHEGFLEINKEILERLGGRWDDVPVFPEGWEVSPGFADLRARARAVVQEDFATSELWAWKDPRTCLTVPFWKQVVGPMRFLLCIRNPLDVTRSLMSRKNESVDSATAHELWLSYVRAALRHSSDGERLLLFYEDLMENWQGELNRAVSFVGGTALDQGAVSEIGSFLTGELWHHRSSMEDVLDDGTLSFAVKSTYLALRLATTDRSPQSATWATTLAEYGVENHEARLGSTATLLEQVSAAQNEATEAWRVLRDHRVKLGRIVATSQQPRPRLRHTEYQALTRNIREQAHYVLPPGATVLVVSKGDPALIEIEGVEAWHFPRNDLGEYAGFHPSSGREAVEHLMKLRAQGATHLLLPRPYAWWLEHYEDLAAYLMDNSVRVGDSEYGWVYEFQDVAA